MNSHLRFKATSELYIDVRINMQLTYLQYTVTQNKPSHSKRKA